jgi:hypothetical protein
MTQESFWIGAMEPFRLSHDMYMLLPAGASDLSCPQALSLWPRREKRFVPSGVAFGFCLAVPISWASSICFHLSHTIVIYPYYKGVWELSALLLPQDPNFRKPPHIKKKSGPNLQVVVSLPGLDQVQQGQVAWLLFVRDIYNLVKYRIQQ